MILRPGKNSVFGFNALVLAISLGLLTVARLLTPNAYGYGTHQALGLPSCRTAKWFGIARCPSCGVTTAYVWSARGRLAKAWAIHPWGPVYYGLTVMTAFTAAAALITRRKGLWRFTGPLIVLTLSVYFIYWIIHMITLLAG